MLPETNYLYSLGYRKMSNIEYAPWVSSDLDDYSYNSINSDIGEKIILEKVTLDLEGVLDSSEYDIIHKYYLWESMGSVKSEKLEKLILGLEGYSSKLICHYLEKVSRISGGDEIDLLPFSKKISKEGSCNIDYLLLVNSSPFYTADTQFESWTEVYESDLYLVLSSIIDSLRTETLSYPLETMFRKVVIKTIKDYPKTEPSDFIKKIINLGVKCPSIIRNIGSEVLLSSKFTSSEYYKSLVSSPDVWTHLEFSRATGRKCHKDGERLIFISGDYYRKQYLSFIK